MPLLLHSNYSDLDQNLLNKVKKKINKSAETQYLRLSNIRSTIQPTKSQVDNNFFRITNFLNQLFQQMGIVESSLGYYEDGEDLEFELSNKLTQEFTPKLTEFSTEYRLRIHPNYNYFSPQQNELIKQDIIKLGKIFVDIQNADVSVLIDSFIEVAEQQLDLLYEDAYNYLPLKINLRKVVDQETDLTGGYIGAGRIYPKTRFL